MVAACQEACLANLFFVLITAYGRTVPLCIQHELSSNANNIDVFNDDHQGKIVITCAIAALVCERDTDSLIARVISVGQGQLASNNTGFMVTLYDNKQCVEKWFKDVKRDSQLCCEINGEVSNCSNITCNGERCPPRRKTSDNPATQLGDHPLPLSFLQSPIANSNSTMVAHVPDNHTTAAACIEISVAMNNQKQSGLSGTGWVLILLLFTILFGLLITFIVYIMKRNQRIAEKFDPHDEKSTGLEISVSGSSDPHAEVVPLMNDSALIPKEPTSITRHSNVQPCEVI